MIKLIRYWLTANKSGLDKWIKDIRDLKFRDLFGEEDYKPEYKSRRLAPVWIKDQLQKSNCSFQTWAGVYGIYFGEPISARYLAAKAFQQGWCKREGWADLRAGARVGQKFGVVLESDLPSNETLSWDEYVNIDFTKYDTLAKTRKIGSYYILDSINDYLRAIDKGYAVAVGREWKTSMNQSGGFSAPWILKRDGLPIGGHATCAMGYDVKQYVDIEANSYSERWGDKGYFYCPLADLEKDFGVYGAIAITPIPYSPKEVKLSLLKKLLQSAQDLLAILKKKEAGFPPSSEELRLKLYDTAKDALGLDLSPTQGRLGCAETLSTLIHMAYGENVNIISTAMLKDYFEKSPRWEMIIHPLPGDVIICATGEGDNPDVPNGHVGVVGKWQIMSNNSRTSRLDTHWTLPEWRNFYGIKGGYPVRYYRRIA